MSSEELPVHLDRRSFVRRTAVAGVAAVGTLRSRRLRRAERGRATHPGTGLVRGDGAALGLSPRHRRHTRRIPARRSTLSVRRARLTDPAAGLSDEALDWADALIWWGRRRHDDVPAGRTAAVVERVKAGRLGFVALHGACASQPFRTLMGTACEPARWREDGRPEHVGIAAPEHPIARGVGPFTIPKTDMFAEPFSVPAPETVVLVSSWEQGETMRSGLTWSVGDGPGGLSPAGPRCLPGALSPQSSAR